MPDFQDFRAAAQTEIDFGQTAGIFVHLQTSTRIPAQKMKIFISTSVKGAGGAGTYSVPVPGRDVLPLLLFDVPEEEPGGLPGVTV